MRIVKVPLGIRSYEIQIGTGLLPSLGTQCSRRGLGKRCAIITDQHVGPLYAKTAEQSLRRAGFEPVRVTVPAGEKAKSLKTGC